MKKIKEFLANKAKEKARVKAEALYYSRVYRSIVR